MIPVYTPKRVEWLIKHMRYEHLSEGQHNLVIKFEEIFNQKGELSKNRINVLENIFQQAEDKEERIGWRP